MRLRELMLVESKRQGDNGQVSDAKGVFVTRESLTFPVAAGIVTILLKLANAVGEGAAKSVWWALGVSLFIGALIYINSIKGNMPAKDWVVTIGIALLNVALLAATGLGLTNAID